MIQSKERGIVISSERASPNTAAVRTEKKKVETRALVRRMNKACYIAKLEYFQRDKVCYCEHDYLTKQNVVRYI